MTKKQDLIVKTALRTLDTEIETLRALRSSIGAEFEAVVRQIYEGSGRVVITGVGKSAIVAQKMVATFNSTGTPALFMHAADAVHGDLGMIQPEDLVICISKSGETSEVKVLLPILQQQGSALVGITARSDSYLGQFADYCLLTPIAHEAEPNNLAPTASTTAQMALGDALATALLALRGFTHDDFARFHPGGTLGKQLYLKVSDLYPRNESPVVSLHTPIQHAILEMTSKRLGATVVTNAEGEVVGMITDGDLRRMLERNQDITKTTAGEVMSRQPKRIEAGEMAAKALQIMRQHNITQLIVTRAGQYVGMVHLHDLLREGLV